MMDDAGHTVDWADAIPAAEGDTLSRGAQADDVLGTMIDVQAALQIAHRDAGRAGLRAVQAPMTSAIRALDDAIALLERY